MEREQTLSLSEDLRSLKALRGTTAKSEHVQHWMTPLHRVFLDMVGNTKRQWFVTWDGVQKAEEEECDVDFGTLFYEAENRIATPAVTASRIRGLLKDGWPENVLKAIVEKTLDAGLTVSSIKKATGSVCVFGPALAADWLKMNDKKRRVLVESGDYVSTPKIDGLRCLTLLHTPDQGAYSRGLKPLPNLKKHVDALARLFPIPIVLDGEMVASDLTWNSSITGAKKGGATVQMLYYVFDCIPMDEAKSNKYVMSSADRQKLLAKYMDYGDNSMFCPVVRTPVKTIEDVEREHDLCVEEGWEGCVLHDVTAPYACKRSTAWVKVKRFLSSEFKVIDFIAGRGKHTGRLGAILVEGLVGTRTMKTEVGTGFSDSEREDIWANQSKYLGKQVEIKYFESTKDGSLRFPSFIRFREDLE